MEQTKYAYRLPPCPAYDVEGLESWLTDLAREGLLLCTDGFFGSIACFERVEPQQAMYRLEALQKTGSLFRDVDTPEPEEAALCEHFGWEFVARYQQFYIYRSFRQDAREPNTDPQVQALALRKVRRRLWDAVFTSLFWCILYPLLWMHGNWLLAMVYAGSGFVLCGAALGLWSFGRNVAAAVHLGALRKKLLAQGYLDHRKDWKRHALRHRAVRIVRQVCIIVWCGMLFWMFLSSADESYKTRLDAYTGEPPFPTMVDLCGDPAAERELFMPGMADTVYEWSDLLAPRNIEWEEAARITCTDGRVWEGGLYVDYHEMASPLLAWRLAEEYRRADQADARADYKEFPIEAPGADYAVGYYGDLHFPTVVLQRGCVVMHIMLYQTSAETMAPERWIAQFCEAL